MRNFTFVLMILSLTFKVTAQEEELPSAIDDTEETVIGAAAITSTEEASDSDWRNWTFLAVTVFVATGAIYAVSVGSGHDAN